MSSSRILCILVAILVSRRSSAQILPTTPGPNETYIAGSACAIAWNIDANGTWTNMSIDLMSGSNANMTLVTNVANGLDGTDKTLTPYNWTCPEVDPYSNIYFYQFTDGNDTSTRAWTMRFTIASSSNETTPPEHPTQPDGEAIPWGSGQVKEANGNKTESLSSSASGFSDDVASTKESVVTVPAPTSTARSRHAGSRLPKEDPEDGSEASGSQDDSNDDDEDEGGSGHKSSNHKSESSRDSDNYNARSSRVTGNAGRTSAGASPEEGDADSEPGSQSREGKDSDGDELSNSDAASINNQGAIASGVRSAISSYSVLCMVFFALLGALVAL